MLRERTPRLVETYALAENDIQVQMLHTTTAVKAGAEMCVKDTRAEAETCCAKHEHAGAVYEIQSRYGHAYACKVDVGTGDWD